MNAKSNNTNKILIPTWAYLVVILALALSVRLTGIWRTESINYCPDEDKIARPVLVLLRQADSLRSSVTSTTNTKKPKQTWFTRALDGSIKDS